MARPTAASAPRARGTSAPVRPGGRDRPTYPTRSAPRALRGPCRAAGCRFPLTPPDHGRFPGREQITPAILGPRQTSCGSELLLVSQGSGRKLLRVLLRYGHHPRRRALDSRSSGRSPWAVRVGPASAPVVSRTRGPCSSHDQRAQYQGLRPRTGVDERARSRPQCRLAATGVGISAGPQLIESRRAWSLNIALHKENDDSGRNEPHGGEGTDMPRTTQLRTYTIRDGLLDEWGLSSFRCKSVSFLG